MGAWCEGRIIRADAISDTVKVEYTVEHSMMQKVLMQNTPDLRHLRPP
eukprot:COSAG02_NODE_43705_length_372_cov_0.945055_1_plen_47_part_10